MKNLIISITLLLFFTSCTTLWESSKDAGTVGLASGAGALLGGPVGAAGAGLTTYLLVDNVNKDEFIEDHVIKVVTQETVIEPTLSLFWNKFKVWAIILTIVLALVNPRWLLIPFKLLKRRATPKNKEILLD